MAESDPEWLEELPEQEAREVYNRLEGTGYQAEFDVLAEATVGGGYFPIIGDTRGFAVSTEEGEYQILGVPFEGTPSHEANIVVAYREWQPEKVFSSVVEEEPGVLTVRRFEVVDGEPVPDSLPVDLTALGDFSGFTTPSLPDKCASCKKVAAAAKYAGCGVAPGAICIMAGVPSLPSLGCDAVGALVCKELQKRSGLTKQEVCERVGLCPP